MNTLWLELPSQSRDAGVLGYQLTLFGPRGADYARHITTGPSIFLDDAAGVSAKDEFLALAFIGEFSISK